MEGDSGNKRGPGQLQTRFRCRCYYHSGGDTEPDKTQAEAEACLHQTESPGDQLACLGLFVARSIIDGQPLHYRVIGANTTDNLLSRSVAVKMGFMKRVYVDEIQDVYGDIGILQCDLVKIVLRENATPYSVCTARRVPIPLLPQVEAELRRMEDNGIIDRVTEPQIGVRQWFL